jgi:hypothetical protein
MHDLQSHHVDIEPRQPLDVGGVKHDVTNLGHISSLKRLLLRARQIPQPRIISPVADALAYRARRRYRFALDARSN